MRVLFLLSGWASPGSGDSRGPFFLTPERVSAFGLGAWGVWFWGFGVSGLGFMVLGFGC